MNEMNRMNEKNEMNPYSTEFEEGRKTVKTRHYKKTFHSFHFLGGRSNEMKRTNKNKAKR